MYPQQKKYECQVCGEVFTYYANKIKHETQCASQQIEKRNNSKCCPYCSMEYTSEISLKKHLWNCTFNHKKITDESKDSEDFGKLNYRSNFRKKWKFCFFENCYCTFYHTSQLVEHIYSSHDDTLKYGIQILEFSNMDEFERWKKLESMRIKSSFILRTNTKKFIAYVCLQDNDAKNKTEKRLLKGVRKGCTICMSRILVTKRDKNIICTYLNVHTHDFKLNNFKFQPFDKEFYNKIKSYICLGVDVNEIYNELIENNSDEAKILYFKEHFRYARKNIAKIYRELRMRDISNNSINKSDDEFIETDEEGEIEEEFIPNNQKRKHEGDKNKEIGKDLNTLVSEFNLKQVIPTNIENANNELKLIPIKISDETLSNLNQHSQTIINIENKCTPLNVKNKSKVSIIKKQIAIIDKHIDDTSQESDLDYFMKLVDMLVKKCKSIDSINDLLNDDSHLLKDSSSIILKYLKYTNDLQENVLFLNNNKIIISIVDLLTLVSPASSKPITYLCKRADPTFQDGRLTETIIDAFCFRLSQMPENKMYIFGNTSLSYQILNTEHGEQFFANINYENKSHLFLPVHCNEVWTLIVFNLEHALYGYLNSVKVNNAEHDRNIKKIINRLKFILPNEAWKQMTFLSVYPKNAERSGVFICFYLECLTKKLPLMTPMKVHRFRLSIFNVIRGNCLREPKIEGSICVICKTLIVPLSMRVRCKECLISYHYDCINLENLNEFVCNDLKDIV